MAQRQDESKAKTPAAAMERPKVNINTATVEELRTLPSVGPCVALMFVEIREKNGPFKSLEDVAQVPGMGVKNLPKVRDLIVYE